MQPKEKIIVALDDITDKETLRSLAQELAPFVGMFKIGRAIDFFGVSLIRELADIAPIMVDTKLHDIPNTTRLRLSAYRDAGASWVTLHSTGGRAMLTEAAECVRGTTTKLIGVTILTSLTEEDTKDIYHTTATQKVLECAELAKECGLYGIVSSVAELPLLKEISLKKITPGIRPHWAATQDQKRIATPQDAIKAGAEYLVIGRPIYQAPAEIGSPLRAVQKIIEELTV